MDQLTNMVTAKLQIEARPYSRKREAIPRLVLQINPDLFSAFRASRQLIRALLFLLNPPVRLFSKTAPGSERGRFAFF